tara:strand:- start:148 stop:504 length:357 start_codon:yes stop_codon:yes gene_type:complete
MQLPLDLHPKYWLQLRKELEALPARGESMLIDMLYESIDDMTCSLPTGNLLHDIYEFQCRHGLIPEELASARQLQKYKGGAGIAKRINSLGIEATREDYKIYVNRKIKNYSVGKNANN